MVSCLFSFTVLWCVIADQLRVGERVRVCENKHSFTILEEFGKGSLGVGKTGAGVPCIWPGTGSPP